MASPGEGGGRQANRLIAAAALSLASFDARADDAGPFLFIALLFVIGLGGILASFMVHLASSEAPSPARLLRALGVAAANLAGSLLVGWLVIWFVSAVLKTNPMAAFVVMVPLLPWILPAALFARRRLRAA